MRSKLQLYRLDRWGVVAVAEASDGKVPAAGDRGHLRSARADREHVIGVLKTAFVRGLLDKDEFDQRVGQTLASRSYAELDAVTADLPAGLPAARPPAAPAPAAAGVNSRKSRSISSSSTVSKES